MMLHEVVRVGLGERTVRNVRSDWNEEKGKKKGTTPQHTSPSEVNLHWTVFKSCRSDVLLFLEIGN